MKIALITGQDEAYLAKLLLTKDYRVIGVTGNNKEASLYNLAAQSSVGLSFMQPTATIHYNVRSVLNLLEAVRIGDRNIRLYKASSSEMFGLVKDLPVRLSTPMHPFGLVVGRGASY
jgi:GDPmannose 4,6-dehydratase